MLLIDFLAAQAVDLLINSTREIINAKNLENKTALDLADAFPDIQRILLKARGKHGASVHDPKLEDELTSKISFYQIVTTEISRLRSNVSVEQRETYMVVAALLVTAIYQTALSPPGGVYQAEADNGSNNLTMNATSSLNFTATAAPGDAGTSIWPDYAFFILTAYDTIILLTAALTILILMPSGWMGFHLQHIVIGCVMNYVLSILLISPTYAGKVFLVVITVFAVVVFYVVLYARLHVSARVSRYRR